MSTICLVSINSLLRGEGVFFSKHSFFQFLSNPSSSPYSLKIALPPGAFSVRSPLLAPSPARLGGCPSPIPPTQWSTNRPLSQPLARSFRWSHAHPCVQGAHLEFPKTSWLPVAVRSWEFVLGSERLGPTFFRHNIYGPA